MRAQDIERLNRAVHVHDGAPLEKLLGDFQRQIRSRALEAVCRMRGGSEARTARTFWGETMTVIYPDIVSVEIDRYGFFEAELTKRIAADLRPGSTFFDVGAHYGYFSLLGSSVVGPSGSVVAFEPAPQTYATLTKNTTARANILTVNAAALERAGTVDFTDYGPRLAAFNTVGNVKLDEAQSRRGALQPRRYTVDAVVLDDWIDQNETVPDFLKIDAEGAELRILEGMKGLLRGKFGDRPMLSMEVGDAGHVPGSPTSRDLVDYMVEHNYRVEKFDGWRWVEHQPSATYEYDNLIFQPKSA